MARREAATCWLTVPMRRGGLPTVAATPMSANTATSKGALWVNGSTAPEAAPSMSPARMMRAAPKRSASMPQKGCARPQVSWLTATAKLRVATPRPVDELSGERKSPTTERDPMVIAMSATAAAVTRSAARRSLSTAAC